MVRIHLLAIAHAVLVSVALAGKTLDYKSYFLPLSSEKLVKFNTSAAVKSFNAPAMKSSAISHHALQSRSGISKCWTLTIEDCLDPADHLDYEDCSAICGQSPTGVPEGIVVNYQGPVEIQPLEIWLLEYGNCVFGIANLDPCEIIDIWDYCYSMYTNCAIEGYDGYLEGTDPEMAMALSGTAGAPPYVEGPCVLGTIIGKCILLLVR